MEASNGPEPLAATEEEKEAAAVEFCQAASAFMESMEKCSRMGVDIVAEMEKLGVELPPFAATIFS